MWNTTNNLNKTIINTPANGLIQKSNEKSWILKMHYNSVLAEKLLSKNPIYDREFVSVLQILLINDGYVLMEVVNNTDL